MCRTARSCSLRLTRLSLELHAFRAPCLLHGSRVLILSTGGCCSCGLRDSASARMAAIRRSSFNGHHHESFARAGFQCPLPVTPLAPRAGWQSAPSPSPEACHGNGAGGPCRRGRAARVVASMPALQARPAAMLLNVRGCHSGRRPRLALRPLECRTFTLGTSAQGVHKGPDSEDAQTERRPLRAAGSRRFWDRRTFACAQLTGPASQMNELRFLKFRLISRIYRPKMVRGRIIVCP
jgi:hypothetical protein